MGLIPVRTSFESPWQNGTAERWVEGCRRDLLDHVIAINEAHLKRLLSEYVRYFHEDPDSSGIAEGNTGRRVRAAARGGVICPAAPVMARREATVLSGTAGRICSLWSLI